MDLASISKVESVVLMGLDFSMRPENVRYEASKRFIQPLHEHKVMHQVRKLALLVYNQEKFTPLYHANVCENSNPLAYFLCAVHRQAAPQPQKKAGRHASFSSNNSSDAASSCSSAEPGKNCELPQLCAESALPLGYWDGLYYAVLAEIRRSHGDLQDKFGWAIENGSRPVHHSGADGSNMEAVTAIELASMLETAWYNLMDNRLVATLDDAVRMRKIRENVAKKHHGTSTSSKRDSNDVDNDDNDGEGGVAYERPPVVEGLVDINGMTAEAIVGMLWEKHAPEIDQACSEDFEDDSMLTSYQAQLHAQITAQTRAMDADPLWSSACRCRGKCICNLRCGIHASHCTCASYEHVYHKVTDSETADSETEFNFVKQDMSQKHHLVGDGTSVMRQMEMKQDLTPALRAARMAHRPEMELKHNRDGNRPRPNTNNSGLAYVPDSKGSCGKGKDTCPLAIYIDGSPGRYPKIRKDSSMASNEESSAAHTANTTRIMMRKPAPPPLLPVHSYVAPDAGYGVVTPPLDYRYGASGFAVARAQAAYHENARLPDAMYQSQSTVTASFPTTSANPCKAVDSDPFVDSGSPPDLAHDYIGIIAHHPSSLEQTEDTTEPFPTLTRPATTTPPRMPKPSKVSASSNHLPTLNSLTGNTTNAGITYHAGTTSKPVPPLPPLPDFIAPRPATVQRYVSAGGSMPLAHRAPIQGPAFNSTGFNTPGNHASGAGISKAELDAKMSDPEWVKTHFGVAAAERVSLSPPKKVRGSADSTALTDSQRSSREAGSGSRTSVEQQRNARSRTSSGVAKLKRVFSRKNSESEWD